VDRDRWERVQSVFHDILDRPESERTALLKAACGDDAALMAEVAALVEEDARSGSVLDRGLSQAAHQVLDASHNTFLPLEEFGPYRIKSILGEGGMGVVYLAEREDVGSLVAIKILRDAWLSPARVARFESEQRTLAQLNHPSIARLLDADCLTNGTPWFVMEFVEGAPLTDYCRAHECSVDERLRLFRSVCEAVEYAHSQAIIHRDLKPSNILVKTDGTVKLLDFGIAKQLENLDEPAAPTRTALRFMTPAYAAPEQFLGGRAGTTSDVYSLGVILYELLAGRLPFDLSKRTPGEAELAITRGEPEKPSAAAAKGRGILRAGKGAWSDLDVLCLTAMHKDPERRYRSVEALIRDVDHYLKGEPLEAQTDTMPYRIGKFVRRNRKAVAVAAVVVTVIATQAAVYTIRLATARNAAVMQAARTQRIQRFMLNLFGGGDKAAGPAQELQVVALIDRGAQEARTLDKEPEVQAELYLTLGVMYEKLGKFDRADSLLESARKIRGSITGQDSVETAESLVAISQLRDDQAQYQEAERLARQALAIENLRLAPDNPVRAQAATALGTVLENDGKYDEAIQVLVESVRVQSVPGGSPPDLRESLRALADAHGYLGHHAIADSLNRRALEIDRQIYGAVHPNVAEDLSELGSNQDALGDYAESEWYLRQAVEIDQSWYGSDHPETAWQMSKLASTLGHERKYGEAAKLLQQALPTEERAYGTVHPKVAVILNEMAGVDEQRGNLDQAETELTQMLDIERSVYGEEHGSVTTAMANLANLYLEEKQYARAEQQYREVVRRFTEEFSADHMTTGIAQIKLGRVLLRERQYRDAEAHTLAGYRILAKQTSPSLVFRRAACEDLAAEYEALRQPERAKQFRAELAAARQ
jgi:eukaryotic-like serine/threonine-protein kinase